MLRHMRLGNSNSKSRIAAKGWLVSFDFRFSLAGVRRAAASFRIGILHGVLTLERPERIFPRNGQKLLERKKVMPSSVKDMLAAANAAVSRIQAADLRKLMSDGNALVVDVRDPPELAAGGKVKGAVNVSRGMLEFRADPESQYYNPAFQKDKTIVLYCGSGGRSALAGKTLQDLGYTSVYNAGAFKDLAGAGIETEAV
jgi:rhodanese-related sulfurtransferase